MAYVHPLENPRVKPTKEDLEEVLGAARYRRFEAIYDELIDLEMIAQLVWDKIENKWYHTFYYNRKPVFNIKWGHDYFYAEMEVDAKSFSTLLKNPKITFDSKEMLQNGPVNKVKGGTIIEANLEHPKMQGAFMDMLPLALV